MSELLLYCHAESDDLLHGRWHFSLQSDLGESLLEASDDDHGDLNRLTLWSAVRGLEAVDGARSVTLLSSSRYLIRSMTDSLPRWRTNNFVWEHFGRYVEVQNADLWRRVDRALSIHQVAACLMQTQMVSPSPSDVTPSDVTPTDADAPIVRVDAAHATVGRPPRSGGSRASRQVHRSSSTRKFGDNDSSGVSLERSHNKSIQKSLDRSLDGSFGNSYDGGNSFGETPLRRMLAAKKTPPSRRFTAAQLAAT